MVDDFSLPLSTVSAFTARFAISPRVRLRSSQTEPILLFFFFFHKYNFHSTSLSRHVAPSAAVISAAAEEEEPGKCVTSMLDGEEKMLWNRTSPPTKETGPV